MTDLDVALLEEDLYEFEPELIVAPEVLDEAKNTIAERCAASSIGFEETTDDEGDPRWRLAFKCGRQTREIYIWSAEKLLTLLEVPFEEYNFLTGLDAICSYKSGVIEAGFRPVSSILPSPGTHNIRKLFGRVPHHNLNSDQYRIVLSSAGGSETVVEISVATSAYLAIVPRNNVRAMTLKISGLNIKQHDTAVEVLNRVSGSLFFQLDMLIGTAFGLIRERKRPSSRRVRPMGPPAKELLQFPKTEFDNAPLSLYWYGRSAGEMPLLQFLAFYQVIEFYFPVYSQSEAQRKLKSILKDPTFRGDRDMDIAKLLAAIHVSRAGAFGDERSQLRATIMECVDSESIRDFIENDAILKEFYLTGSKSLPFHKIPIASHLLDLRGDIAERIYDIRCKIVHTKSDARDAGGELLLPFSKEAELLTCDIRLVQNIAQLVLIAGSRAYNM